MWITGLVLVAVVVVMALDIKMVPLEVAAGIGALVLLSLDVCRKSKPIVESTGSPFSCSLG